jgi:hypothetical protein
MNVEKRIEAVRRLCSFEGRVAGTDAERRAANDLAAQLRGLGRRAEVESIYVHPQWPLVLALHCLLALAGSLVAIELPAVGFGVVLLTAISMYLDLNGRAYLLRRLFFRRASQNVVSRGRNRGDAGTLVLCANYDTGRSGLAYGRSWRRLAARVAGLLGIPFSPGRLVFWSIFALLPLIGLRMAEVDASWISTAQLPPTLVLVVAVFLLVDIQLSNPVAGANLNASGTATVLSLADELEREPAASLDVWVVLAGAGDPLHTGLREFVRGHRDDFDPESTWFIAVEGVGAGDVRFATSQGPVVSYGMASRLTELCQAIADADSDRDDPLGVGPHRSGFATGSLAPVLRRLPATTVTCLEPGDLLPAAAHTPRDVPDALDPEALERAHRFCLELVRALDRDLARRRDRQAERESAVV